MKYEPIYTNKFKKNFQLMKKRGMDLLLLETVMGKLIAGEKLDEKYCDHALIGNFAGKRDCHVKPDWVLIYSYSDEYIIFESTGTHADLFD